MREIKFRAWDKVNERMYPDGFSISQDGKEVYNDNEQDISYHLILMQFTGLKDKNGKEIYEGDVVRSMIDDETKERVIDMGDGVYWFLGNGHSFDNKWIVFEIIGNIYENPELLTNT